MCILGCFLTNLPEWQEFHTTAGRTGRAKYQLCQPPLWTILKKSDDLVLGVVPYRSFVNLCRICFWWVSAVDDKIFDSGVPTQSKYWTQEGYTWAEMRNWWRRKTKTSHLSPLSVAQSGTGQAFSMALCPHTPYTCVAPNNNTKVLYCDILWMQYIASFWNIAIIREYRDILPIFLVSGVDQFRPFMMF